MPRDSNGNYTLPAGNPVVTLTTITSSWANTTLADLATAMTDSLDRSGAGGMIAPLRLPDGTVGVPSLSWNNDPNTGLYRSGADTFRFSSGGNDIAEISSSGYKVLSGIMAAPNGAVGGPGYSFIGDLNTGMYNNGSLDDIRFACGGIFAGGHVLNTLNTQTILPDGSAGQPALSFLADLDTGFFRDTANQIGIGLAGATAGQFAQGSFTLTITGVSGTVTTTATYQRYLNQVTVAAVGGVTNASTGGGLGLSGLPAAIRPTNTTWGVATGVVDNGTTTGVQATVVAAGTVSFIKMVGGLVGTAGTCGLQNGFTMKYVMQ